MIIKNTTQELLLSDTIEQPSFLWLEFTDACNLNCKMCRENISYFKTCLEPNVIKNLLGNIGGGLVNCHIYMRGESLLVGHDYMEDILYNISLNVPSTCTITIVTNGILLDDYYISLFSEYGVDVVISFDASNKNLYENIRRGTNFELVVSNAIKALDASVLTGFYTSVQNDNFDDLFNIISMAESIGVPALNMGLVLIPVNCAVNWNLNSLRNMLYLPGKIANYNIKVNLPNYIPGHQWTGSSYTKTRLIDIDKSCNICKHTISVSADGCFSVCFKQPNIDPYNNRILPDVLERTKIASVINGVSPPKSCYPCSWTARGLADFKMWQELEDLVFEGGVQL